MPRPSSTALLLLLLLFSAVNRVCQRNFCNKAAICTNFVVLLFVFPLLHIRIKQANQIRDGNQSEACTRLASQSAVLCQWRGCHSACHKSMNRKNDFETSSIIFEVDKQQCRFKHDIWGWREKKKRKEKKKVELTY